MKVHVLDGAYVPARAHFDDAGIDFRSPEDFTLKAHMVLIPCLLADIEPVDELDLSESGRDASGWGSTGR